jgi:S-formylglutathione hydrolase
MQPGWTTISIAGKPAAAFEPPSPLPFALIQLHDDDGLLPSADPAFTAILRQQRLRCLAPHGDHTWWLDRIVPAFDPDTTAMGYLLDHVLPWVESNWNVRPAATALIGVGMGGQGAIGAGFRHPDRFVTAASLDGAFDFHELHGQGTPLDQMFASREQCRQATAILHIQPHSWPRHIWFGCSPRSEWYRGNDRLAEKLAAMGVPHTAVLDDPGSVEDRWKSLFTFVRAALERESHRLL